MNILIITTFFPPDTAIAAVRPYMFAKYLTRFGHSVTVLRSGEIINIADRSLDPIPGLRIISFLGENSPAEVFSRGEEISFPPPKSRISFLPEAIRVPIARAYHACARPLDVLRMLRGAKARFSRQREFLHALRAEGARYDAVFATYANLENVYAGEYAAGLFGCPWILDLRDPIASPLLVRGPLLSLLKRVQDKAVSRADACTVVSDGLRTSSPGLRACGRVLTLYNGYEPAAGDGGGSPEPGVFSICYTGALYGGKRDISPLLEALKRLSEEGHIDLARVRVHYAGLDFQPMRRRAEALGMEACLVDHGYVTREEAGRLQKNADIFLALSWNSRTEQGVISGKFYEGIRCGRPILALVAGDAPNSELYELNQQYRYGFCYEACRGEELFPRLCDFLLRACREKLENGRVPYAPPEELSAAFRYDTLARQLEALMEKLADCPSSKVNSAKNAPPPRT